MSFESGLEELGTIPLSRLFFARPVLANELSAMTPYLDGSSKRAGLLPPNRFICVEQQMTSSIKHSFANVQ